MFAVPRIPAGCTSRSFKMGLTAAVPCTPRMSIMPAGRECYMAELLLR